MDDFNVGGWRGDFFGLNAPEELLTDDFLMHLSALNKGVRMERTADGILLVRSPPGVAASLANAHLTGQLGMWHRQFGSGEAFGSSIGYHLPNSAVRSPDASWVSQPRWDAVMKDRDDCFPPLSPDFAAELLPAPHEREEIEGKMREYVANGAHLGWLIDPRTRRVEVYRPGRDVEVLEDPATVSGEDVLPGFTLDLTRVWG